MGAHEGYPNWEGHNEHGQDGGVVILVNKRIGLPTAEEGGTPLWYSVHASRRLGSHSVILSLCGGSYRYNTL